MLISDTLAADIDANDITSVTLGTTFGTSANTAGLNFDDADTYELVYIDQKTLIRTDQGKCPVEELRVGDVIPTKEHGPQQIRWIGSRKFGINELKKTKTVSGTDYGGRFGSRPSTTGSVGFATTPNAGTIKNSRAHVWYH